MSDRHILFPLALIFLFAGSLSAGPAPKKAVAKPAAKAVKAVESAEVAAPAEQEPEEKAKTLDDFPGRTFTGKPRLIRTQDITEVFFRDLRDSYVIHSDSKHNRYYKVFDEASKLDQSVTFRADPRSRRILAVEGVDGVIALPAAKNPAMPDSSTSRSSSNSGSK